MKSDDKKVSQEDKAIVSRLNLKYYTHYTPEGIIYYTLRYDP